MTPAIVVVGSLNMDFVVSVERLPAPGETVLGRDFQMIPGGKGANQACAAGKLGAGSVAVRMIGRVGYDVFADHLKASLAAAGRGRERSACHALATHRRGADLGGPRGARTPSWWRRAPITRWRRPMWRPCARSFAARAWRCSNWRRRSIPWRRRWRWRARKARSTMLDPAPAQPLPGACWSRWTS